MKTKAIASILVAFAVVLLALSINHARGKAEAANLAPAAIEKEVESVPVQHVGMGENQPLP